MREHKGPGPLGVLASAEHGPGPDYLGRCEHERLPARRIPPVPIMTGEWGTIDLIGGYPFAYIIIGVLVTFVAVEVWLALRGGR